MKILRILVYLSLFISFASNAGDLYVTPIQPVTLYSDYGWDYDSYHAAELKNKLPKNLIPVAWPDTTHRLKVLGTKTKNGSTYYQVSFAEGDERCDPEKGKSCWLNVDLTVQGAGVKPHCPPKPKNSIFTTLTDFVSEVIISTTHTPSPLTADFEADGANKNCHAYIKPDGSYGPRGKLLLKELSGKGKASLDDFGDAIPDVFLNPEFKDMNEICPNFSEFRDAQKYNFWIWSFAALAWDEGKCIENVTAEGTNTLAVSDFQLPENWDPHRKYRGPGCNATEPRMSSRTLKGRRSGSKLMANPKNAIPCAVQIMAGVICGWYAPKSSGIRCNQEVRDPALLGSSQSYWQKIKTNDSKLKEMISQFPDCKKR